MDLKKVLSKEAILLDLAVNSLPLAIAALCHLSARLLRRQVDELLGPALQRESLGSTAVGGGVAIPHGKVPGLTESFLAVARVAKDAGPDFLGPDGLPVRVVALVLSPITPTSEHLQILALLGRLWNTPEILRLLLSAPDKESFYGVFLELAAIAA
ncbi:MAG: PTS sugar transporter subunit IIA [Deltaproteobacteria bacterium]|jgi:PTS system nitrogen regulatory IIA component|nr:PTS sugar transporter subunit IIA [Deltaproteobacteria bacterium]